ncbi:replication-associated protein [Avon-Heathcote Estuary associated circular virus 15]|uniref:replication-associated protein n=1 Tax=Avon-Heathcote Estuary associated circular virus 15 TaxID=1618238 RepID=UPI0005CCCCD4|nr:replication-associated protein [Avon-Heathcote Estuary associated circular virus 15]AJP36425.1 replication-associated protein [Avon-Heathcote Estuary associated circular virus 15]AJP36427.1 replication-associated protein [Avon-Heathcote Estuary associated circular virus 15]
MHNTTALQSSYPNRNSRSPTANRDGAIRNQSPRTQQRLSRFVFTLNNWTEAEYTDIIASDVKWLVVGKEIGDEGTPHLQGAVVIGKQIAFSTVKKWPGFSRAHIENMRGKPFDSLKYCTKQDTDAFCKGEMPQEGKRNDLHDAINALKQGGTLTSIVKSDDVGLAAAVARYSKGLAMVSSMLKPRRSEPPLVIWLSGETGVGKTRSAVALADRIAPDNYWISAGSLRWFDGYDGHAIAIFDDLRTKHAEFSFLLRLLDRYPLRVEFKGGFIDWTPSVIVVTAPKSPTHMWSLRNDEDKQQLERRIHLAYDAEEGDDWELLLAKSEAIVAERWPTGSYPWKHYDEVNVGSDETTIPEERSCSLSTMGQEPDTSPSIIEIESDLSSEELVISSSEEEHSYETQRELFSTQYEKI